MGDMVQVTIDQRDKEALQRAASKQGITIEDYLRRIAAGTNRPLNTWQSPLAALPSTGAEPPKRKSFQERMDELNEFYMNRMMMQMFPGAFNEATGRQQAITIEDVARLIDERFRRGEDGGEDSMLKMMREAYRAKQIGKVMKELDTEDTPPALKAELAGIKERFDAARAQFEAQLKAKDDEISARKEEEKEARTDARFEALRTESLAGIQRVEQAMLTLRHAGANPPKDQIETLVDGIARLESLKGRLDTTFGSGGTRNQRPWWIDDIEKLINTVGDNAGRVLEGYGSVEAGRHGLAPPGSQGGAPPGAASVYGPNYVDQNQAPPRPPSGADPYPQLTGYATDPADLDSWPDIPYSEGGPNGAPTPLTKQQFVAKYGQMIHAQRQAAGVLPAPSPPPPALEEVPPPLPDARIPGSPPPAATPRTPPPPAPAPAAEPDVMSALSGGATPEPPPPTPPQVEEPPAEEPAPEPEVEIPEGVYDKATTTVPTTVDMDGSPQQ